MTIIHLENPSVSIIDTNTHQFELEFSPSHTVGKWIATENDLELICSLPSIPPSFKNKTTMKSLPNLWIHTSPLFNSLSFPRKVNVTASFMGNPVFIHLNIHHINIHKMKDGAKIVFKFDQHTDIIQLHNPQKGILERDGLIILENPKIVIL